ncbi:ras guanine nucleotide exchange factor domain-containing protein [Polychytrium aggregatum]|uniref:ras guanine nucleotide exchange factor domain-containing protein n=1 Tax=Polychytrium aggregatum TaxID=110093 RepID=UPI0022FE1E43|nr:ras guanine nucleotide exchange factor domain-containing protein [Polychytrium aggregatum]KAI9202697.1 ras guanine nucleotide exchange factor domain-containing protein [Polychytrium aggregatum]
MSYVTKRCPRCRGNGRIHPVDTTFECTFLPTCPHCVKCNNCINGRIVGGGDSDSPTRPVSVRSPSRPVSNFIPTDSPGQAPIASSNPGVAATSPGPAAVPAESSANPLISAPPSLSLLPEAPVLLPKAPSKDKTPVEIDFRSALARKRRDREKSGQSQADDPRAFPHDEPSQLSASPAPASTDTSAAEASSSRAGSVSVSESPGSSSAIPSHVRVAMPRSSSRRSIDEGLSTLNQEQERLNRFVAEELATPVQAKLAASPGPQCALPPTEAPAETPTPTTTRAPASGSEPSGQTELVSVKHDDAEPSKSPSQIEAEADAIKSQASTTAPAPSIRCSPDMIATVETADTADTVAIASVPTAPDQFIAIAAPVVSPNAIALADIMPPFEITPIEVAVTVDVVMASPRHSNASSTLAALIPPSLLARRQSSIKDRIGDLVMSGLSPSNISPPGAQSNTHYRSIEALHDTALTSKHKSVFEEVPGDPQLANKQAAEVPGAQHDPSIERSSVHQDKPSPERPSIHPDKPISGLKKHLSLSHMAAFSHEPTATGVSPPGSAASAVSASMRRRSGELSSTPVSPEVGTGTGTVGVKKSTKDFLGFGTRHAKRPDESMRLRTGMSTSHGDISKLVASTTSTIPLSPTRSISTNAGTPSIPGPQITTIPLATGDSSTAIGLRKGRKGQYSTQSINSLNSGAASGAASTASMASGQSNGSINGDAPAVPIKKAFKNFREWHSSLVLDSAHRPEQEEYTFPVNIMLKTLFGTKTSHDPADRMSWAARCVHTSRQAGLWGQQQQDAISPGTGLSELDANPEAEIRYRVLDIFQDGKLDKIKYEEMDGLLYVSSGTAYALLDALIFPLSQDMGYSEVFLASYRFFMSPRTLLNSLVEWYNVDLDEDASSSQHQFLKKNRRQIQGRVAKILLHWIKKFWHDFTTSKILLRELTILVDQISQTSFGDGQKITQAIREQRLAWFTAQYIAPFPMKPSGPSSGNMPLISDSQSARQYIANLEPEDLALNLTTIERFYFGQVTPSAYLHVLHRPVPQAGAGLDPSLRVLVDYITWFSSVSTLVSNYVGLEDGSKKRGKAIKKFIKTAKECKKLQNYNTIFAIIHGLKRPWIVKLSGAWESLSTKHLDTFRDLDSLMDPTRGFHNYWLELGSAKVPLVPCFALHMHELIDAFEEHLTYEEPQSPAAPVTPSSLGTPASSIAPDSLTDDRDLIRILNFNKFYVMYEIITDLEIYRNTAYPKLTDSDVAGLVLACVRELSAAEVFGPAGEDPTLSASHKSALKSGSINLKEKKRESATTAFPK